MDLWKHLFRYRWIYAIILFIILIIILVVLPIGLYLLFTLFSWLFIISKHKSMVRGKLSSEGPNILEWFDNICYINSINYLFSAIDSFEDDILETTNNYKLSPELQDKEYLDMINSLIKVIRYINKRESNNESNREFIEEFKKVCLNEKNIFWFDGYNFNFDPETLGQCASGKLGRPTIYLKNILVSSGLNRKYEYRFIIRYGQETFSNYINKTHIDDNIKDYEYIFIYIGKDKLGSGKMIGIRDNKDVKNFNSFDDFYVYINNKRYDIISYSHIYGSGVNHSLTTRRFFDENTGNYKWFKMMGNKKYKNESIEIDLKELKRTILWGNTFYLLRRKE